MPPWGDGSLTNNRRITGGYGKFYGGDGAVVAGGTLLNAGTLTGGGGSVGVGDGALVQSGTLTNDGLIIAGAASGLTGIGVELTGGTLVNAGTISGSGGGAAVQFGGAASLVLDPGAIFIGTVIADVSAADTLVLAGTLPGTLSGLGQPVQRLHDAGGRVGRQLVHRPAPAVLQAGPAWMAS